MCDELEYEEEWVDIQNDADDDIAEADYEANEFVRENF